MKGRGFVDCDESGEELGRAGLLGWGTQSPARGAERQGLTAEDDEDEEELGGMGWGDFFVVERINKKGREGNSCLLIALREPQANPLHTSRSTNWCPGGRCSVWPPWY